MINFSSFRFAVLSSLSLFFLLYLSSLAFGENLPASSSHAAGDSLQETFTAMRGAVADEKMSDETINLKLKDAILPSFDFSEFSKRCIGPAWERATAEEQTQFTSLLSEMLSKSFLGLLRKYVGTAKLAVSDDSEKGERARVKGVISYQDDSAKADFWMIHSSGKWRVHNVVVENFSLEKLYIAQFSKIAEKEGVNGLISRLQGKA